jgi:hypothetical protein
MIGVLARPASWPVLIRPPLGLGNESALRSAFLTGWELGSAYCWVDDSRVKSIAQTVSRPGVLTMILAAVQPADINETSQWVKAPVDLARETSETGAEVVCRTIEYPTLRYWFHSQLMMLL